MWCINVEMIYDELLLKYTCLTFTCMMTFNLVLCTLSDPEGLTECRRWSISTLDYMNCNYFIVARRHEDYGYRIQGRSWCSSGAHVFGGKLS